VTVTELARSHGPRAIQVLAQLMNDEKAPASARAAAAETLPSGGMISDPGGDPKILGAPHPQTCSVVGLFRVRGPC
jgi:hypothetical protein